PLHCSKSTTRIRLVGEAAEPVTQAQGRGPAVDAWCRAILDASRKRLSIEPETPETRALWLRYRRAARHVWRARKWVQTGCSFGCRRVSRVPGSSFDLRLRHSTLRPIFVATVRAGRMRQAVTFRCIRLFALVWNDSRTSSSSEWTPIGAGV